MAGRDDELRTLLHPELRGLDDAIRDLYHAVRDALGRTTQALLNGDHEAGLALVREDEAIDDLAHRTERLVQERLEGRAAMSGAVASDVRFLVTAMRIVPELERSADLVGHIAELAAAELLTEVPAPARQLVVDMGARAARLWEESEAAYVGLDVDAADRLDEHDDELDVDCRALLDGLEDADVPVRVAMDMALLGRFYERLGDHAVHLASRVRYLAGLER